MLFAFGVTVAPFFEELIFRGFLLPAMASAWDWCAERLTGRIPPSLDPRGNPVWSLPAMVFASLAVSVPFALMHSAQVNQSWGPLVLLYCVSLVLCTVRLSTRSLAASTVVHSAYNFILFAIMAAETAGFRHLDKL
jgi:membrane protease YdiL (CAAX protease family)